MLATLEVPASATLFGLSPALLMDIAIKGSLILLFALVATRLLRSASAATRHTVWAAAILAQLAIPALAGSLPEWRLAILPPAPPTRTPLAGAPVVTPAPTPSTAPSPTPGAVSGALAPGAGPGAAPAIAPTPAPAAVPTVLPNAATAPEASVTTPSTATPSTSTGGLTFPDLLVLIWAVGGAAVLLRLSFGTLQVWRMARRSRRVTDPRWLALSQRIAEDVRLSRPLTLLQGGALTVPVTFGILFPVVLLPADAHLWPADRRRIVLLHEVAHVKRLDAFTQVVSQLVLAVFWFNPLVWVALKNMRAERERACDDYVLRGGMKPSVYVDDLIAMVRSIGATTGPAFAALAMARRSEFEGRMLAILDSSTSRRSAGRLAAVLTTLAVLALAAPLAAMRAVPQSADNILARRAQEDARAGDDSPGLARRIADSIARRVGGDARRAVDAASIAVDVNSDPNPRVSVDVEGVKIELGIGQGKGEGKGRGVGTGEGRGEGYESPEARTAAVASLITAIGDEDGAVKLAAIQALGSLEDPRAVEALSDALRRDPDPEVREMAAWALGEIENAAAVPALSEALRGDREVAVRLKAAWALGEIESARGVEALGAALRDENVEVRRMAIWALGEIESPQAVPLLVPLLDEQDREVREKAAWALGEIESPQAVEGLTKALRDADVRVRETVVWALGEIESASAGPALATALKDENVAVRRKAAWALGEIDGLDAAPPELIAALGDTDREVRLQAARALGEIQDPAAVPALAAAARGQDEQLRRAAAWALSEMREQAAIDVLIELLRSDDPEIRKAAAQALGKSN